MKYNKQIKGVGWDRQLQIFAVNEFIFDLELLHCWKFLLILSCYIPYFCDGLKQLGAIMTCSMIYEWYNTWTLTYIDNVQSNVLVCGRNCGKL